VCKKKKEGEEAKTCPLIFLADREEKKKERNSPSPLHRGCGQGKKKERKNGSSFSALDCQKKKGKSPLGGEKEVRGRRSQPNILTREVLFSRGWEGRGGKAELLICRVGTPEKEKSLALAVFETKKRGKKKKGRRLALVFPPVVETGQTIRREDTIFAC